MAPSIAQHGARALVVLWFMTAVLTGLPGLLLLSFAEDIAARVAAFLLIGTAIVEVVTAGVVRSGSLRVLRVSLAASGLVLMLGVSAQIILSVTGHLSPGGLLLCGGFSVLGAVVTASVVVPRLRPTGAR